MSLTGSYYEDEPNPANVLCLVLKKLLANFQVLALALSSVVVLKKAMACISAIYFCMDAFVSPRTQFTQLAV